MKAHILLKRIKRKKTKKTTTVWLLGTSHSLSSRRAVGIYKLDVKVLVTNLYPVRVSLS